MAFSPMNTPFHLRVTFLSLLLVATVMTVFFVDHHGQVEFSPTPAPLPKVRVALLGDIMLSRYVGLTMNRNNDYTYPVKDIAHLFDDKDIVFANLESPLSIYPAETTDRIMSFGADVRGAELLGALHVNMVSLANNHSFDRGSEGMNTTIETLDERGLHHIGMGPTPNDSHTHKELLEGGMTYCFNAYTYNGAWKEHLNMAVNSLNEEYILKDIEFMKNSRCDVIALSLHWGYEYMHHPNQWQRDMAHRLVDAGADVIIGHHPHVVQDMEIYNDRPIFYSLGNFVFDQQWSTPTMEVLVPVLTYRGTDLLSIEYMTFISETGGKLREANDTERTRILGRLGQ